VVWAGDSSRREKGKETGRGTHIGEHMLVVEKGKGGSGVEGKIQTVPMEGEGTLRSAVGCTVYWKQVEQRGK